MEKQWIKYVTAAKGRAVGDIVQTDAASAKTLIDNGIAEATEAPPEVTSASVELKALATDIAQAASSAAIAEVRKQFGTTLKHNLPGDADKSENGKPWATAKRYKGLEAFPNTEKGQERAYRFGMWCLANASHYSQQFKSAAAVKYCRTNGLGFAPGDDVEEEDGVRVKTTNNRTNQSAGFLVPDEFENDLIDLRERYGLFRRYAKKVPMIGDQRSDPRRRGGITSYWVGEDASSSYSDKTWDRVRLNAKKMMAFTRISSEINEDAVINLGDDFAKEVAYSFANKEDLAGFNGDSSSTYGGITGVTTALKNVDATVANVLGLTVATGTGYASSYGSITLGDFHRVVGLLPEYADTDNACWFVHRSVWGNTMQRLAAAVGGNTITNIQDGARQKMFLGYPVVVSQVMPKTPAINQVVALLGDLSLAASFGDRRATTLKFSDVADNAFIQDEIVIRGTQRVDINVHDVGESSAGTARDPVMGLTAGPVVGLITASS